MTATPAHTASQPLHADDNPPARRSRTRLVWLLTFVALTGIASLWAVGVPAGGQPDEPVHLSKGAAVVRGEFTWLSRQDQFTTEPGRVNWTQMRLRVPRSYQQLGPATACAIRPPIQPQSCTLGLTDDQTLVEDDNYVAAYPPLPYLAVGWPSLVLPLGQAIVASRLTIAVLCAAFMALAFVSARRIDRSGFFTLGIVVAITPGVVFFTSTSNPNGLEMATAICLAAATIELLTRATREESLTAPLVSVTLSGCVLVLTRPASLAVVGVLVGTILLAAATRPAWRVLWRERAARVAGGVLALTSLLAAGWVLYARPLDTVVGIRQPPLELSQAISKSFERFPQRVREMIGVYGWGDTFPPGWVLWTWTLLVVAFIVGALVVGTWRRRAGLAALVVVNVVLPTIAEVPKAQELGFIWNGRYSTPFVVAVPILAAWIIGERVRLPRAVVLTGAIATSGFVAGAMFVSVLMTFTRFADGSTTPSVFGFLQEPSWQPHGGAVPYVVATAVATVGYGVVIVWLVTGAVRCGPRRSPSRSTG